VPLRLKTLWFCGCDIALYLPVHRQFACFRPRLCAFCRTNETSQPKIGFATGSGSQHQACRLSVCSDSNFADSRLLLPARSTRVSKNAGQRSGRVALDQPLHTMRLDVPVRRCRPDTDRATVIVPYRVSLRTPEKRAATRRKLIPVLDHASGDAINIGNFGATKSKGIARAGLLLLERISVARFRPQRRT
jgi:hypothetical protein